MALLNMERVHKISENLRVRLGDWGIYKGVLILEERDKFLFFYTWKRVTFCFPTTFRTIDDAIKYLLYESKAQLSNANLENIFK